VVVGSVAGVVLVVVVVDLVSSGPAAELVVVVVDLVASGSTFKNYNRMLLHINIWHLDF
jgi:hypothetical protein